MLARIVRLKVAAFPQQVKDLLLALSCGWVGAKRLLSLSPPGKNRRPACRNTKTKQPSQPKDNLIMSALPKAKKSSHLLSFQTLANHTFIHTLSMGIFLVQVFPNKPLKSVSWKKINKGGKKRWISTKNSKLHKVLISCKNLLLSRHTQTHASSSSLSLFQLAAFQSKLSLFFSLWLACA